MSTSTITLAELRTQARYRANQENSLFCTEIELNTYINNSAYELYDLLTTSFGDDYYVATPYSFTANGTSQTVALPNDFLKLLGVDLQVNGNSSQYVTLKPFKFNERNRNLISGAIPIAFGYSNIKYRLKGSELYFNVIPMASQGFRLWYIPQMTKLVEDDDTLDGVDGWQEYVIIDAAIKMMIKEESDISALVAQKAAMMQRIKDSAANRDAGEPSRVSDVLSSDWDGSGFNDSGYGNGGY